VRTKSTKKKLTHLQIQKQSRQTVITFQWNWDEHFWNVLLIPSLRS